MNVRLTIKRQTKSFSDENLTTERAKLHKCDQHYCHFTQKSEAELEAA